MSFTLQLSPDLVSVEPGASVPISVTVENRDAARERYEMEIEGVDPEWKAVPVPVFEADSGEKRTERFFFKPPRASESQAGDYPFVVRVRSLNSGESQTAQGVLQVKPFHHLSMDVSPKRGIVSPAHRSSPFEVTLVNLGNSEHTVRLMASDAEEECAYELESDQVTISPGAQRQIEVKASPKQMRWFTSGRLVGISFNARSVENPSVVSTSQAQLELRPILSITTLAIAFVVAVVFFAWYLARPKPIKLEIYPDHESVTAGDPVMINWHVVGANRITIKTPTDLIYSGPLIDGQREYRPSTAGTVDVEATATQDNGDEKKTSFKLTVKEAEQIDPPTIDIDEDALNRMTIKMGESFRLTYHLGPSVTKATLQPDGIDLSTDLTEVLVKPTAAGKNDYMIDAQNSKGEHTSRNFSVNVIQLSDANILLFEVDPKQAGPDVQTVTVSWKVSTNAGLVQLYVNDQQPIQEDLNGKQDFPVTGKTTFKLIAKDESGRAVTKSITVPYIIPKITAPLTTVPPNATDPNPNQPLTAPGTPTPTTTGTTTGGNR